MIVDSGSDRSAIGDSGSVAERDKRSVARLEGLQALRAVAALMVVLYHLQVYTMPDVLGLPPLWSGLEMGYAGVEIFFVLSGFIMYHVHADEFGRPVRAIPFLKKRFLRIYPFYWIVLVAALAAGLALDGDLPGWDRMIVSVTLWPGAKVIEVAWTLTFEMLFYIVFVTAILDRKLGIVTAIVWTASVLAASLSGHGGSGALIILSSYNLLFLLGIGAGAVFRSLNVPAGWVLFGVGAALFLAVGLFESVGGLNWAKSLRTVLYGVGACALVAGLAALDRLGHLMVPRWLSLLGDASYAIYLVHIMAMTAVSRIAMALVSPDLLPSALWGAILFAAAALTGLLAHLALERPLLSILRRRPHVASRTA